MQALNYFGIFSSAVVMLLVSLCRTELFLRIKCWHFSAVTVSFGIFSKKLHFRFGNVIEKIVYFGLWWWCWTCLELLPDGERYRPHFHGVHSDSGTCFEQGCRPAVSHKANLCTSLVQYKYCWSLSVNNLHRALLLMFPYFLLLLWSYCFGAASQQSLD